MRITEFTLSNTQENFFETRIPTPLKTVRKT